MVALSAIAARQSCATVATKQAVHLLLDYVATLCAHLDVGYLNETNSCSCTRAHIFLSENKPFPLFNGAVLSITQIIKFVMVSDAKSGLAALFVTEEKRIPRGKPSSLWVGPNQKALSKSKQITQLLQVLPIKQLFPAGPKRWICASCGSIAAPPKTNSVTTGTLASKTGLTTTPNTTRTPTMKPTKVLIQASGTR